MARLAWTATHQSVAVSAQDNVIGKLEVLHNGAVCQNVMATRVVVHNDSSKDLENVDVLLELPANHFYLAGTASTNGVNIPFSPDFQQRAGFFLSLKPDQREYPGALDFISRNRGFRIPYLNRDQRAEFSFLVHKVAAGPWRIELKCVHKGVQVKETPSRPLLFGLPQWHVLSIGLAVSIVFTAVAPLLITTPYPLAFACLAVSALASILGAALLWAFRLLLRFLNA